MQRQDGYQAWLDAVKGFQDLHASGRYRIVFFVNHVPPACAEEDVFYDGGSKAIDDFYVGSFDGNTPTVSCYGAFLHVRPSQMPNARAHPLGNSNAVKADVLFAFLRDRVLPSVGGVRGL
jgi:hypothetical protein